MVAFLALWIAASGRLPPDADDTGRRRRISTEGV